MAIHWVARWLYSLQYLARGLVLFQLIRTLIAAAAGAMAAIAILQYADHFFTKLEVDVAGTFAGAVVGDRQFGQIRLV